MSRHLVRCRGGEWLLIFPSGQPVVQKWLGRHWGPISRLRWNASREPPKVFAFPWPDTPAWLPIAWLCCEADPTEGPGFAAAILDAAPGDDAPALIACDWLEEIGAEGRLESNGGDKSWQSLESTLPLDWPMGATEVQSGPSLFRWDFSGPLASWGRALIATRCVSCGGRRDGEDLWGRTVRTRREARYPAIRALAEREGVEIKPDCPLCGFPAHATPPPLATPEVVR